MVAGARRRDSFLRGEAACMSKESGSEPAGRSRAQVMTSSLGRSNHLNTCCSLLIITVQMIYVCWNTLTLVVNSKRIYGVCSRQLQYRVLRKKFKTLLPLSSTRIKKKKNGSD